MIKIEFWLDFEMILYLYKYIRGNFNGNNAKNFFQGAKWEQEKTPDGRSYQEAAESDEIRCLLKWDCGLVFFIIEMFLHIWPKNFFHWKYYFKL